MRKVACAILSVFLAALLSSPALADGMPVFSVSDAGTAEAGDTTTVNVDIDNNPGIAAFHITLEYDKSRLELVRIDHTGMNGGTWSIHDDQIAWFSFNDSYYNGSLLQAMFQIRSDAADGYAEVSISYREKDIGNISEERVYFSVESGGVMIGAGSQVENQSEIASVQSTETPADTKTEVAVEKSKESGSGASPTQTNEPTPAIEGPAAQTSESSSVTDDYTESDQEQAVHSERISSQPPSDTDHISRPDEAAAVPDDETSHNESIIKEPANISDARPETLPLNIVDENQGAARPSIWIGAGAIVALLVVISSIIVIVHKQKRKKKLFSEVSHE